MATMSFMKLVASVMGGVGCLGMGSVAVGHKALGISELPERPEQQKHEVGASIQITRLFPSFHVPFSNDSLNRNYTRCVASVLLKIYRTALTVMELPLSLELAFKLKRRCRELALAAADSVALGG